MSGYLYATHFYFMQLVFDLGNSIQKCAVFHGDEIVKLIEQEVISLYDAQNIFSEFKIQRSILASVIDHESQFENYLKEEFHTIILSHNTPIPIINKYTTPETLGKDRLACAVGAWKKFTGKNVLAIDAGTCIKYDFVDASGIYHGGAISPGLNMRFKALHNYTAKLPLLNTSMLNNSAMQVTGDSTEHSIISGASLGAAFEVDGVIDHYIKTFDDLQVLLTGGDAPF
ncbi:MAG: type III pantothenate kinase, partial [Fimbriimonadaceae bacterium]|nr:type III pantothenate kinase [Chitinophagales bacterium]